MDDEDLDPQDALEKAPDTETDVEHEEVDDKSVEPADDVDEADFDEVEAP